MAASNVPPAAGIAIFDLDGTLTYHDTLLPYLCAALVRAPRRALALWHLPLQGLRYLVDRDRGRLKGAVIRALLRGLTRAELGTLNSAFVDSTRRRRLRPGAIATVERHRARGDYLVLLSASPDLYVPALGAALGFEEVICTTLVWDGDRLDGRLASPNCRGDEKRRIVSRLLESHAGPSAAYGNAASDLDHLVLVSAPVLVNGDSSARRQAGALGISTGDWP